MQLIQSFFLDLPVHFDFVDKFVFLVSDLVYVVFFVDQFLEVGLQVVGLCRFGKGVGGCFCTDSRTCRYGYS